MTKAAAIYNFFSSFGIPAYEENSIYDTTEELNFPYLTYELKSDSWNDGQNVPVSVSLWYREHTLTNINAKTEEISHTIGYIGTMIEFDGGKILITRGHPFAQTAGQDADDLVKRKIISLSFRFYSLN